MWPSRNIWTLLNSFLFSDPKKYSGLIPPLTRDESRIISWWVFYRLDLKFCLIFVFFSRLGWWHSALGSTIYRVWKWDQRKLLLFISQQKQKESCNQFPNWKRPWYFDPTSHEKRRPSWKFCAWETCKTWPWLRFSKVPSMSFYPDFILIYPNFIHILY